MNDSYYFLLGTYKFFDALFPNLTYIRNFYLCTYNYNIILLFGPII